MSVHINTFNFFGNTIVNSVVGCQVINHSHPDTSRVTKLLLRAILNRHDCIAMLVEELGKEQLSPQSKILLSDIKGFINDSDQDIKMINEYIDLDEDETEQHFNESD